MSHFEACAFVAAFHVETFICFGAVEDGLLWESVGLFGARRIGSGYGTTSKEG